MQITPEMKVHFVGIAGSGMSPLARILRDLGCSVSGSDIKQSGTLDELQARGITVYTGHRPDEITGNDLVVASAAVPDDDVELKEARKLGIEIATRAQLLGALMKTRSGIAVTGTHGKTTTSAMISLSLIKAGQDPTSIIGSSFSNVLNGGRLGFGEFMIVEADEAYGSFLFLDPKVAVITNIDDDHRDHYGSFEGIKEGFRSFVKRIDPNGLLVFCFDDEETVKIAKEYAGRKLSYSLDAKSTQADYTACNIVVDGFGAKFTILKNTQKLMDIELSIPGEHNVSNALACVACVDGLGLDVNAAKEALHDFVGARRRCQILARDNGITVVDDYAHHPVEIKATLKALKEVLLSKSQSADGERGRLIAVFQPQRYTRTQYLMDEFAKCFKEADIVGITEIYSEGTGEEPIEGVTGEKLAKLVSEDIDKPVEFFPNKECLEEYLHKNAKNGDLLVMMGAGDIYKVSHKYADFLEGR